MPSRRPGTTIRAAASNLVPLTLHHIVDLSPRLAAQIDTLSTLLNLILKGITTMSAELDALAAQVKANNDLLDSATTLINGISARIDAAVAAAKSAGASPEELAQITQLAADLRDRDAALAAAVTANTSK